MQIKRSVQKGNRRQKVALINRRRNKQSKKDLKLNTNVGSQLLFIS